jgi:AcrR family transcriptional regulator
VSPSIRKEKQARTRAKLMRSASKLFCTRGLEQASVDDIAQDAGYTKGAFYSNFKSKEELFLAMLDQKFAEELERIESALRVDESPDEAARHAGEDLLHYARSDPEWERLQLEFVAYAGRNEEFRQEFVTRCRAMDEQLAEVYRRWAESFGVEPPVPYRDIAQMTSVMTQGFLMFQHIDPDIPDDLYGTMVAAFTLGLLEMAKARDAETVRR